jgi:hypothetical protein
MCLCLTWDYFLAIAALNAQSSPHRPSSATQWPSPLTPQYYLAEMATPEEVAVVVTADDFAAALRELVPSVSQAEMARYAQIRERFSGSVNASNSDDNVDGDIHDHGIDANTKDKGKDRDDGSISNDKGGARRQ